MQISLRPAVEEDYDDLLRWKNDPTVRKYSIVTHDEIQMENHLQWLKEHLSEIQIITDGEIRYGDIRIRGKEIAIKIDPRYRSQGIGSQVLKLVARRGMFAKIVEGNIISMRLFLKYDFVPTEYENGYYIFQK